MRHLEAQSQRLFIKRVRLDPRTSDLPIFAIPNGGKRGKIEAALIKAEGVLAGVPDIFVAVPRRKFDDTWYHGLFLEFKTETGRLSAAQAAMFDKLKAGAYFACVVRSAEEAWEILIAYLNEAL